MDLATTRERSQMFLYEKTQIGINLRVVVHQCVSFDPQFTMGKIGFWFKFQKVHFRVS